MIVYSTPESALELGDMIITETGKKAFLVKHSIAKSTKIISENREGVLLRLWPKGQDFINQAISKGYIAEFLVPQLFDKIFNGTLEEFKELSND